MMDVDAGSVARIHGLKALPALNGQLCQILRAGETPDRLVVRTRVGEKALKPANLEFGFAVFPAGSRLVAAALLLATAAVLAAAIQAEGHSPWAAAGVPVCLALVLVYTISITLYLHWPCMPKSDEWQLPSISELGTTMPARHVYRVGFMTIGLLFTVTVWLYSELIIAQLAEPLPGSESLAPSPTQEEVTFAGPTLDDGTPEEVDSGPDGKATADEPDGEGGAADGNATNGSNYLNSTSFLTAPQRSVEWGFAGAVGVGLQAIIGFDGRLSLRSFFHLAGMALFVTGGMQHSMLSITTLAGQRGRRIAASAPWVERVWKFRKNMAEYGPLGFMIIPMSTQYMNFKRTRSTPNQAPSFKNALQDSGVLKSLALLQWAFVLMWAVFCSTFACDFWAAAALPP